MARFLLALFLLAASAQDTKPAPRVDLAGDALPEGAVCRLGTRRWRTPGRVWSLAFHPDGKSLLVGAGTSLLLWDLQKNERIRVFQGHRGVVGSIALLPDGARALTASGDGTLALWDLASGKRLRSYTGHDKRVWSVAVTQDGKTALSTGMDGTIGLWNVETGERTGTLTGHKGSVMSAIFVRDGAQILSGGADGRIILWDVETGARLKSIEAHRGEISGLVPSPDGRSFATTSGTLMPPDGGDPAEGEIAVWDLVSGRRTRLIRGRAGFLWSAFLPDSRGLIAGCADRTAAIWDLESGEPLGALEGLGDRFHPIAIRDGVVAVGDGTAVALFDAATGRRRFDVPGHSDGVGGVGFLPDGRAVTAGADGWIGIWDPATGRRVKSIDTGALEFGSLALSADGKRAVTGGWRVPVSLWNVETGERIGRLEVPSARALAFGPGSIAADLLDGRAGSWDVETGAQRFLFPGRASGALAVRSDGKRAVVGGPKTNAAVIDYETGTIVRRLEDHARDVTAAAFAPDGSAAATGGADGTVIVWDGDVARERRRFDAGSSIRALAFGPGGLVAAGHGQGMTAWDMGSGKTIAAYRGHSGGVTSVAIDAAGRRAITGSGDTTAIVWELPAR